MDAAEDARKANIVEHWYVYYKLPAAELPSCVPQVRALQDALRSATGVQPRLQTRVDAPDGVATVMEVYADIADAAAFGARFDAALASSGLPQALRHGRRTERFRDL